MASQGGPGTQLTAVNHDRNRQAFCPGETTTEQLRPRPNRDPRKKRCGDPNAAERLKRPRHEGNGASQHSERRASLPSNAPAASTSPQNATVGPSPKLSRVNPPSVNLPSNNAQHCSETADLPEPANPPNGSRQTSSQHTLHSPPHLPNSLIAKQQVVGRTDYRDGKEESRHSNSSAANSWETGNSLNSSRHSEPTLVPNKVPTGPDVQGIGRLGSTSDSLIRGTRSDGGDDSMRPSNHGQDIAAEREYGHTVTDLSPDSPPNRVRCGDNPGDPIHISSPPLQTDEVVMGLTLPELSGTIGEQLATLIKFGASHWPRDDLLQFKSGKMITGRILYELLSLELEQFGEYTLGVPPQRAAKATAGGSIVSIVMPYNVNDNHWVIAIIDKKRKTFIAYGMTEDMLNEYKVAYQDALQVSPLEATLHPLQDYTGNTCAFRCCDALARYLGTRSAMMLDPLSLRLFYLQRLLQSRLYQPDSVSVPSPPYGRTRSGY